MCSIVLGLIDCKRGFEVDHQSALKSRSLNSDSPDKKYEDKCLWRFHIQNHRVQNHPLSRTSHLLSLEFLFLGTFMDFSLVFSSFSENVTNLYLIFGLAMTYLRLLFTSFVLKIKKISCELKTVFKRLFSAIPIPFKYSTS